MVQLITYRRKDFFKDLVIMFLIMLSPFIIYIHLKIPEAKTFSILSYTIDSKYYEDISTLFWIVSIKAAFVITFSLWFITCKHWWRYSLLIPLIIYTNQLIVTVKDDLFYVDSKELSLSLIFSIPIVFIVIFLSRKLNYYSKSKYLAEDLDNEIKSLFQEVSKINSRTYDDIKQEVTLIRHKKDSMDKKTYLANLIALRDSLG